MKVGVVGCGAVGSYYGARLCQAGHETHFLLRSDYAQVRAQGVAVLSYLGDFAVRPQCAREPSEIGICDLVLIGLKTTANHQFPRLLPPLVGPTTTVLTLQNGLGNEEQLARFIPATQILGGMCFVCLNRIEPGAIRHMAHGRIVIGEFQRPPTARTHEIAQMFRNACVPCDLAENLERAHWEKLLWNIPFNGLGVASAAGYPAVNAGVVAAGTLPGVCLPTDALLQDPRWEALLRELMREVIRAAAGKGFVLPEELIDLQMERTRTMGAYKASSLLDYERGLPMELGSMFLQPLRQARAAKVATPCLAKLCRVLQQLDEIRRESGA